MQTFVVTIDVIQQYPGITTKRFQDIRIILSEKLCRDLVVQNTNRRPVWLNWERITRSNPGVIIINDIAGGLDNARPPDYIEFAERESERPAAVVTDDPEVQEQCLARGITVWDTATFRALLKSTKAGRTPIDDLKYNVVLGLIILIVIAFFYSAINIHLIEGKLKTILISGLLIIFGFFLFSIRQRFKLAYALVEIVVGIAGVCSSDLNALKVIGGLYIIVRGLDNTNIALKQMKLFELQGLFSRILFLKEEEKT